MNLKIVGILIHIFQYLNVSEYVWIFDMLEFM